MVFLYIKATTNTTQQLADDIIPTGSVAKQPLHQNICVLVP